MTGKTAAKVAFKMVKTLMISGVIIAICIVVMLVNQALGIILMMLYSSFMVIKSSRKEMPLNKFTALLPGVMALSSFLVMFALLGVENPILPLIGCGAGVVFGLLMAKGHRVYKKNGVLFSERTFFYISIWTLSLLFTQGSTLAGIREVTDFGLLLNGFTSLGVIVLSIFLFKKANTNTPGSNGGATTFLSVLVPFVLTLIIFTFCFNPKQISNNIEPLSPSHTGEKSLNTSPHYYTETSSLNAKLNFFTPALIFVSTRPISSFDVIQASNLGVVLNMPRQILEEIISSLSFLFILQSLFDNLTFTADEATAGALITFIQLFMGLGMSAAMTAAQEAANAATQAGQATTGDGSSADYVPTGNRILEGTEAEDWMKNKDNGYFDENGNKTEKFDKFIESMPSEPGPGLQGFGGKLDDHNNPIGDYTIIVPNEKPAETSQAYDSSDMDEQHEATNIKSQDQSTDSSVSDSDDKTTTKTDTSDTKSPEDNQAGAADDSGGDGGDDDQDDTPGPSNLESKDKKPGINTTKPEPPVEQPPVEYPNAKEDLGNIMAEITKEKIKEGNYVRNPHRLEDLVESDKFSEQFTGYFLGTIFNLGEKSVNNAGELIDKVGNLAGLDLSDYVWHPIDDMYGWKGGQCGDYAQKGIGWSRDKIIEQYGENVKFDKIIVKSSLIPNYSNHAATRVSLPNGDKYVLDYWESLQSKKERIYTEDEWIKRHSEKLNTLWQGTETIYETSTVSPSAIKDNIKSAVSVHKRLLDMYISNTDEHEGKKQFLEYIRRSNNNLSEAAKLVSQWKRKP